MLKSFVDLGKIAGALREFIDSSGVIYTMRQMQSRQCSRQ
jgi:hypothetical protein